MTAIPLCFTCYSAGELVAAVWVTFRYWPECGRWHWGGLACEAHETKWKDATW